ncbi:MAG: MarR family transcriptional regulator [Pseudomonadota bacterium]
MGVSAAAAPGEDLPADALLRCARMLSAWAGVRPNCPTSDAVLLLIGRAERTTAGKLAATLAIDLGHMSRIVRALQDDGLVRRERSPLDARAWWLSLTAEGRATCDQLECAGREQARRSLRQLPRSEAVLLAAALVRLGAQ